MCITGSLGKILWFEDATDELFFAAQKFCKIHFVCLSHKTFLDCVVHLKTFFPRFCHRYSDFLGCLRIIRIILTLVKLCSHLALNSLTVLSQEIFCNCSLLLANYSHCSIAFQFPAVNFRSSNNHASGIFTKVGAVDSRCKHVRFCKNCLHNLQLLSVPQCY